MSGKNHLKKILSYRHIELKSLQNILIYIVISTTLVYVWPIIISIGFFLPYKLDNNHQLNLNIDQVLYILAMIGAMRFPLSMFPKGLRECAQGYIALKRLDVFLNLSTIQKSYIIQDYKLINSMISINNISFNYYHNINDFILKNINLTINQSEFIIIIGKYASGKTSLLNAILGEMNIMLDDDDEVDQEEEKKIKKTKK